MRSLLIILFGFVISASVGQERLHEKGERTVAGSLAKASLKKFQLDSVYIYQTIDSIITNGIKNYAFPGAQFLVAKEGQVIFNNTYGYQTYDSIQPLQTNDLYDLASVTKIMGPLPALMKLLDEKKLQLDIPFSTYWKPWRHRKDKKDLSLRELLAHQAGLQPYIVFLEKVLKKNGSFKKRYLRTTQSKRFLKQAYEGIFIKNNFQKKVFRVINRSKVAHEKSYTYSGLVFLLFPEVVQQLTGVSYQSYLQQQFYKPMGLRTLGFLPMPKKFKNAIIPTELDTVFRHTLTQGWVHDENAALLGGVSGNAGLFGTALDLAKMMQLYLQGGIYEGRRFISEKTVAEFTKVQYPENNNRRGLGFDKPYLNNKQLALENAYPNPEASPQSFGHSGFTGTFVWADPNEQLLFIFLSNRVYPTRTHRNLYNLHIRPALLQVFYKSIAAQN